MTSTSGLIPQDDHGRVTRKRVAGGFLAARTVTVLFGWTDFALEDEGRLTEPLVDDKYRPISWESAFELVGATPRGLDSPHQAVDPMRVGR